MTRLTREQRDRWDALCRTIRVKGPLPLTFDIRDYEPPCIVVTMKTQDASINNEGQFIVTFKYPLQPDELEPRKGIVLKYALLAYQHECCEQIEDLRETEYSKRQFGYPLVHPEEGPEAEAPDPYKIWAIQ